MSKEKILVIVESPNKVEHISQYLQKDPLKRDFIVLATKGHIADLSNKGKYKLGIDIDNKFELNYVLDPEKKDKLSAIINTAIICDKIYLATDNDREGECIASLVYDRIKTVRKPTKRVIFKEITQEGILKGLENEMEINENLVQAAKARRALDRIVGFMGSPFIIRQFGEGTSAGRVQSVVLRLIVEREREIENFKPEEYWNLKVSLTKEKLEHFVATYHTKDTISSKEQADALKEEFENSTFKLTKLTAKPKPKAPMPPLNTAKMQSVAYSRYRLSPTATMESAQRLFEAGRVTYIRTDSIRVDQGAIDSVREWIGKNHPDCLPAKQNVYKVKKSAQDAHEAIRPINVFDEPQKDPQSNDEKLYKIIWEIFVASQMTPAIYDTTSFVIHTDKKKEFRANGRILKKPGWLVIASNFDIDDEKDSKLPNIQAGDQLTIVAPRVVAEQKFTQPPPRFKKPTLIEYLYNSGIGRPSTYASIMDKICHRNFVTEKKDALIPTQTAYDVVDKLKKYFSFMEYNFTADMESKLDLVEHGKYKYLDLMNDFYKPFKAELDSAYKGSEKPSGFQCPKCQAMMVLKESKYGKFLGCANYPTCKTTLACEVVDGKIQLIKKEVIPAPDDITCPICRGKMHIRTGRYGQYYCCLKYPNCSGHRNIPCGQKCPKCGNDLFKTIFYKKPYCGEVLCCMGYPDCEYVEPTNKKGE
jgi:DNA topoisomerase-1